MEVVQKKGMMSSMRCCGNIGLVECGEDWRDCNPLGKTIWEDQSRSEGLVDGVYRDTGKNGQGERYEEVYNTQCGDKEKERVQEDKLCLVLPYKMVK